VNLIRPFSGEENDYIEYIAAFLIWLFDGYFPMH
jgi:hypothetical protein